MIPDCKDLDEKILGKPRYYTPQSEEWGQPPASNYIFAVENDVMYGQITGSNYLSTHKINDFLLIENQRISELANNEWLALSESAFAFWDNEQDAIFDNL